MPFALSESFGQYSDHYKLDIHGKKYNNKVRRDSMGTKFLDRIFIFILNPCLYHNGEWSSKLDFKFNHTKNVLRGLTGLPNPKFLT